MSIAGSARVSSTTLNHAPYVKILVHLHFGPVNWFLILEAIERVSELVT